MVKRGFELLIALLLSLSIIFPTALTSLKAALLLLALVAAVSLQLRGNFGFA